jgi:hypothetical protein
VTAFLFNPTTTLYKADGNCFKNGSHLIAVDLPEPEVKKLADIFARHYALLLVPDIRWRLAASALRAMFIMEQMQRIGQINWIAQTMCAGYGPAGIYGCFSSLAREGVIPMETVPKFLGFQQEANAPMVRAWTDRAREISRSHVRPEPDRYIEPGLYNTNPGSNYTRLADLISYFGGDMLEVNLGVYDRYEAEVVALLDGCGVMLDRLPSGEIREKTAILTGAGLLQAIHEKRFRPGERVLFMVTGGAKRRGTKSDVVPSVVVDDSLPLDEWVEELGERFNLETPTYSRKYDRLFSS